MATERKVQFPGAQQGRLSPGLGTRGSGFQLPRASNLSHRVDDFLLWVHFQDLLLSA